MATPRPRLVITPGDPDGIGPEIAWKAARRNSERWRNRTLLYVGARKPFDRLKARVIEADPSDLVPPRESRPHVWLLEAPTRCDPSLLLEGYQAGWSIETATSLVLDRGFSALVTGPIHKERLNRGGYRYSGHTDFLASLCAPTGGAPREVTMMLANDFLRVSLVTAHVALHDVPAKVTAESVERAIEQTIEALHRWWGVKKPRIAVCAMNPHAGEGGLFGREDIEVVAPAVERMREKWGRHVSLTEPLPSDTLFARHMNAKRSDRFDAVVALYHDQGLIPVKLVDFPRTVNVTLGLPIVRTSVDHGTAFDIAWKNRADPRSYESAVELAYRLASRAKRVEAPL